MFFSIDENDIKEYLIKFIDKGIKEYKEMKNKIQSLNSHVIELRQNARIDEQNIEILSNNIKILEKRIELLENQLKQKNFDTLSKD